MINQLTEAVQSTGLPVNFILVSDHGMTAVDTLHPIAMPAFKKNTTVPSFENVHVYPLVADILGLPYSEKIDGNKKVLQGILK